jgi:hypothetical protein
MKVFILEDSETRINWFKNEFNKFADLTIATSYIEAIKLYKYDYEALFLDHDLGEEKYNNGFNFCKWLIKNQKSDFNVSINIHSHNPLGSDDMFHALLEAGFYNTTRINFGDFAKLWGQGTLNFLGHYKYS